MRTLLSALVALALIAPAANAVALYRCTMTGDVHAARCCPRAEHEPTRDDAIAPEDCCQPVQAERDTSPSADPPKGSLAHVIATAAESSTAPWGTPREIAGVPLLPSTRGPPARDLWLVTRSLLL